VHPIEWMSGAFGPVLVVLAIPAAQGEMSCYLLVGWQAWRTLHEIDIHSGLRSPLTRWVPLWGGMKHHDLRHAKPTRFNYSILLALLDCVFGATMDEKRA
jgi:sterol desaturase/sphingolipid hydroxylase (fatty acid hydroxylase superfamily)